MPAHVSQDAFLSEVNKLMNQTREKGSVYITFKVQPSAPVKGQKKNSKAIEKAGEKERECLVRARVGKKRVSTVVKAKDVVKFQQTYQAIIRANLDGLKRREKKKKTKS
uniref:Signal recognition particle 14 kDa protein n=1 Tax=Paramoeba aestuarina TaxID=180227 RepID=A0A7S4USU4_9EUKA|eukprot:CAMPEP_0201523538 /NCGR_PEP_ID=MMETSP0161_2-20130828/20227_1 /ASSEMBLY_ACC=CAM_ASM_000251 /TAXON_ID=180227 /ORGANISM="Neoparamoeba aestuarina, Strain SoJaBio B1-5/56/2" /LENGTH=108 /DNA_ID=CAMNT_0047922693 /DNA_START=144 /DNA_END=470 /DNA_ORIENTATION=-